MFVTLLETGIPSLLNSTDLAVSRELLLDMLSIVLFSGRVFNIGIMSGPKFPIELLLSNDT